MPGIGSTLSRLRTLRDLFERGLKAASGKYQPAASARPTRLREIKDFGRNPGDLRMHVYVPDGLDPSSPLVVALHGCTQTAEVYDRGTGWSDLADRHGFIVIFPEQQPANNPKNCFSWFLPGDITRDSGEALSIRQMIAKAEDTFAIDRSRVFVTGLSAGGAMACVMLATYPEIFAGGAIIAGLPYGVASSVQEAFEAMFNERAPSSRALGGHVRAASSHRGPWPKVSVWHGTADTVVRPSNADHIIRQWLDVHKLPERASSEEQSDATPGGSGQTQAATRGLKPTVSPAWLMAFPLRPQMLAQLGHFSLRLVCRLHSTSRVSGDLKETRRGDSRCNREPILHKLQRALRNLPLRARRR